MRFKQYLNETLKPSEFRPLMKIPREKNLYNNIFQGKDRIYIPFEGNAEILTNEKTNKFKIDQLADFLSAGGYELIDYFKGYAKKKNSNSLIRIGKILSSKNFREMIPRAPDLLKQFENDPQRTGKKLKQDDLEIVISRHPYDIGGMSTDRGWTSCMNLKDGCNKQYVNTAVEEGTCIAYLIKKSDKNIKNPISRILLIPYYKGPKVILYPSNTIYGSEISGFTETIKKFLNKKLNTNKKEVYYKNMNIYNDMDKEKTISNINPKHEKFYNLKFTNDSQEIVDHYLQLYSKKLKKYFKTDDYIFNYKLLNEKVFKHIENILLIHKNNFKRQDLLRKYIYAKDLVMRNLSRIENEDFNSLREITKRIIKNFNKKYIGY